LDGYLVERERGIMIYSGDFISGGGEAEGGGVKSPLIVSVRGEDVIWSERSGWAKCRDVLR